LEAKENRSEPISTTEAQRAQSGIFFLENRACPQKGGSARRREATILQKIPRASAEDSNYWTDCFLSVGRLPDRQKINFSVTSVAQASYTSGW